MAAACDSRRLDLQRHPAEQGTARYWIDNNWIWGPDGAADMTTGYWITAGWILGPDGAADATTGFYISGGRIWGPTEKLPFVRA